jgi:hypothetical protein
MTTPLRDALDTTYSLINLQEAIDKDGDFHDKYNKYLAYSFYIKNTGKETFDVNFFMTITERSNGLDEAIRVLLIEGNDPSNTDPANIVESLYQKEDKDPTIDQDYYMGKGLPRANYFVNNSQIFSKTIERFIPGQIKRYTFFFWLEGWDPEDTNELKNGRLKASMQFQIVQGNDIT